VGKNRREAERALTKIQSQIDDGAYRPQENIRFSEWGDRWIAALRRKESTRFSYNSTIAHAKEAFGHKPVRRLSLPDVTRFLGLLREQGLSESTQAKHLRVLGACLRSAVQHGYAARNPVRELPSSERPQPAKKEAAYFETDELPRLFRELQGGPYEALFLAALKTGMRQGELLALTWGDADLQNAVIRVRRSYSKAETSLPKNKERRDVDLTSDLVELLAKWWGECGKPADSALVFPGPTESGYIEPTALLRELYGAMNRAGIPRVGPTGEKRTFHSFRHTFAKRALESGRQVTWLSRHLGHATLTVTTDVYGHWERATRKAEAAQMEGVFGV
jgi:integrase